MRRSLHAVPVRFGEHRAALPGSTPAGLRQTPPPAPQSQSSSGGTPVWFPRLHDPRYRDRRAGGYVYEVMGKRKEKRREKREVEETEVVTRGVNFFSFWRFVLASTVRVFACRAAYTAANEPPFTSRKSRVS